MGAAEAPADLVEAEERQALALGELGCWAGGGGGAAGDRSFRVEEAAAQVAGAGAEQVRVLDPAQGAGDRAARFVQAAGAEVGQVGDASGDAGQTAVLFADAEVGDAVE